MNRASESKEHHASGLRRKKPRNGTERPSSCFGTLSADALFDFVEGCDLDERSLGERSSPPMAIS